jgi:DNA-directed RNA polymerase beta' subunit
MQKYNMIQQNQYQQNQYQQNQYQQNQYQQNQYQQNQYQQNQYQQNQYQQNQYQQRKYTSIGLSSPDQIRKWCERYLPSGELVGLIKKANTIHYQTAKPEMDGLFCEKIFGPIQSGCCACGKYTNMIHFEYKKCCEECGVELTSSETRRYNMGYIALKSPVTHIWYLKAPPSLIASILNQPLESLEALVYYDV